MRIVALLLAVAALLAWGTPADAWSGTQFEVSIVEFKFDPKIVTAVAPGDRVHWTNNGTLTHTTTGKTALGLWDSGNISPGNAFTFEFDSAGTYPYRCSIHPRKMTGSMKVPTVVFPATGNEMTSFTITWGFLTIPSGYNADIQIKRPHSRRFKNWMVDQSGSNIGAMFTPDKGPGKYKFRTRLQNDTTKARSGWSPVGVITVS